MNNSLLNMQIGAQRRVLGWLPEIAARRDARLIVGMGLATASLTAPSAALATQGDEACTTGPIQTIINFIDFMTKALIAIVSAVVILRFAMAAWTLVASNKANRGKKALNDMMWVGAGLVIIILIFPIRWGILTIVEALFPGGEVGDQGDGGYNQAATGCAAQVNPE